MLHAMIFLCNVCVYFINFKDDKMKRFFSHFPFVLAILISTATVFTSGCGSSGGSGGGASSTAVRLSGTVSASDSVSSLKQTLRGNSGKAIVDLYYIVALKALFISKKQIFYGYLLQGISPNPQSLDNPIRVIEELRRKVFAKVDPDEILGDPDSMPSSRTILQEIVSNRSQLTLPANDQETFITKLNMLAKMSMPVNQPQ
jgi:hypothetical protein